MAFKFNQSSTARNPEYLVVALSSLVMEMPAKLKKARRRAATEMRTRVADCCQSD